MVFRCSYFMSKGEKLMTRIKCDYMDSEGPPPRYCDFRGKDGYCSLEEIEMGFVDSGWWACCENKHATGGWSS